MKKIDKKLTTEFFTAVCNWLFHTWTAAVWHPDDWLSQCMKSHNI